MKYSLTDTVDLRKIQFIRGIRHLEEFHSHFPIHYFVHQYWNSCNIVALRRECSVETSACKHTVVCTGAQIAKFMGPTWGPPGSCRPQMGPMLAPWTLYQGVYCADEYVRQLWWHLEPGTCYLESQPAPTFHRVTEMLSKQRLFLTFRLIVIVIYIAYRTCGMSGSSLSVSWYLI